MKGYALASTTQPVAVSRYELTEDAQKALPDEDVITRAFADELSRRAPRIRAESERYSRSTRVTVTTA